MKVLICKGINVKICKKHLDGTMFFGRTHSDIAITATPVCAHCDSFLLTYSISTTRHSSLSGLTYNPCFFGVYLLLRRFSTVCGALYLCGISSLKTLHAVLGLP